MDREQVRGQFLKLVDDQRDQNFESWGPEIEKSYTQNDWESTINKAFIDFQLTGNPGYLSMLAANAMAAYESHRVNDGFAPRSLAMRLTVPQSKLKELIVEEIDRELGETNVGVNNVVIRESVNGEMEAIVVVDQQA